MTVILSKSRFLHVPKTGGSWVVRALIRSTPDHLIFGEHTGYGDEPGRDLLSFMAIRKPEGYYQSYWAYRMRLGWRGNHPLDVCESTDFQAFIENVLDHRPAYYSDLLRNKYYEPGKTLLLCFDRLADDLVEVLNVIGEEFSEETLRETPRRNTSDYHLHAARWNQEQRQRINAANQFALDLYRDSQRPKHLPMEPRPAPLRRISRAKKLINLCCDYLTIRASGEFDRQYYLNQPGMSQRNVVRRFPIVHFVSKGEHQGKTPNSQFSASRHLRTHPEAAWERRSVFADYLRKASGRVLGRANR